MSAQPFAAQLVATSAKNAVPQDLRAATLDVIPVEYCSSGYLLAPSFTLDQPLSHTLQANFAFLLDVDNDENFEYEVMSKEDWFGRRLVSDKLQEGRVFVAGDAAHLWVPYAGYGMNAGLADASNLAWHFCF